MYIVALLILLIIVLFMLNKSLSSYFMNRGDVISLVVKSLKNPRSAVCKTAIMTSADIFNAYNDLIIESLDPLVTCIP